jgi:putative zinc finger/helix-turn-helix YgiT family protein
MARSALEPLKPPGAKELAEDQVTQCDDCGRPVTTEHDAVRRYDIGGLPHVELHGVEVTRCAACGKEGIAISRIDQLHRVLAEAFVTERRMLAPVEIRFLRKHIGLSAGDFAQRMGVARETVSRWETGTNTMGAVADRLLRLLVVTHEPTECYAVDDLLRELNDEPAPKRLSSVPMWNSGDRGWTPREGRQPARV